MTTTTPGPRPADTAGTETDGPTARALVETALNEGPMPRFERLEELEGQLRCHVELLLPSAEAAVDGLWHGSVAWYGKRARLDKVHHHLAEGFGEGLMSALIHVRHLAHDCNVLLDYLEPEQ